MKIGLIGPGIMTIPPSSWGAVEILIWDYYKELTKLGHSVSVINKIRKNSYEQSNTNTQYCKELIEQINNENFDFVHLHYDNLYHILPFLKCVKKALTSHYPYIDQINKHHIDGYSNIFKFFIINHYNIYNFVLADKDIEAFKRAGASQNYIRKLENGITSSIFKFSLNPDKFNKTIYLGKIDQRKNQYKYQNINSIEFVGPLHCNMFVKNKNYLGSWRRDDVNNKLTEYGNLLLLSKGEADPLVVKEALIAGLGVVVNYTSGQNLDDKPFITIIPDNKVDDIDFIEKELIKNREISVTMREEIRKYGIQKFDINVMCKKYINIIEMLS